MKDNSLLNATNNSLQIRVMPESISYAITDENEQVVLKQLINVPIRKLKEIQFLEQFFEQPELRVFVDDVSIVFENSNFQLIPSDLFREEDIGELYSLEFGKDNEAVLDYNMLPKWGIHLIYGVAEPLKRFFGKKYPEAEYEHHIIRIFKNNVKKNSDTVYAYLRKDVADLVIVKNKTLLLANSFQTKTNEDVCYFILNAYEQLELDTESFTLKLLSENAINGELLLLMRQYITNVETD